MSWSVLKLGECCLKIGSGATPKGGKNVYIESGVRQIRSQNVRNLEFDYEGLVCIADEAAKKLRNVEVEPRDVLLNITGDSVARTCMVPDDVLPARVNQHVAIIRPDSQRLDAEYLSYYLASPFMQSFMLLQAAGKGVSRNALTKDMIAAFEIPCPEMKIQREIVEKLQTYDSLIENNCRQIKLLEEAAQRLYKEWFIDLRFPDHKTTPIINGLPEGWRKSHINELFLYHDSVRIPLSSKQREQMQGSYPYYGAASCLDYINRYLFDGVYLLLGEDGTVTTPKGLPVLQYVSGCFWVNNHAHVITGRDAYSTEFIYTLFSNLYIGDIVSGAAQPKISQARLNSKIVSVADKATVIKFSEIIEPFFKNIVTLRERIDKAKEARDRLLPKLMSGEIEI